MVNEFLQDEAGQGLTEYALLLTLIALACVAAMSGLATSINAEFTKIAGKLT